MALVLDNTTNTLYERVNDEYAQHRPRSRRSRYYTYDCIITPTLPINVLLASVHLADECIQLLNTNINCLAPLPPDPQPTPQFIREDIINILKQHLPPWASQRVGMTPTLCKLKAAIINSTAVMVSDGSHFPLLLKAGQAWCISTLDYEEFICGGGATPGDPNDHDSYQSEVALFRAREVFVPPNTYQIQIFTKTLQRIKTITSINTGTQKTIITSNLKAIEPERN